MSRSEKFQLNSGHARTQVPVSYFLMLARVVDTFRSAIMPLIVAGDVEVPYKSKLRPEVSGVKLPLKVNEPAALSNAVSPAPEVNVKLP